jgi:hypothetical protein
VQWKRLCLPYKSNPSISSIAKEVYDKEWTEPFLLKLLAYEPPRDPDNEV